MLAFTLHIFVTEASLLVQAPCLPSELNVKLRVISQRQPEAGFRASSLDITASVQETGCLVCLASERKCADHSFLALVIKKKCNGTTE